MTADQCLEDRPLDHRKLKARTEETQSEPIKWNKAYAYLANGADVTPAIDTGRRCKGPRLDLYRKLSGNRA
jgi:hypothetical protein